MRCKEDVCPLEGGVQGCGLPARMQARCLRSQGGAGGGETHPAATRHPSKEGMVQDTKRRQGVWPVPSGVSAG